jgi:hemerythrin-like metal-binding protein
MEYIFSDILQKVDTGIDIIDCQHKMIDESINVLANMMASRNPDIERIMCRIRKQCREHFLTEEKFLSDIKGFNEHKQEHNNFIEILDEVNSPDKMIILLKKWNEEHIINKDIPDFEYLRLHTKNN